MSGPDPGDGAPLLRAQGASFGYRGAAIISGVDLTIQRGELLGIVGPNGAGKTTLFRGLLGLIEPIIGRVDRARVAVGYVPQREELDAVYPLNVREIVQMGAYGRFIGLRALWRRPSASEDRLAEDCLAAVGLAGKERACFSDLSGGQRQRVLLARALMTQPRLLMLDEPTAGVDRRASAEILELIGRLGRERGMAVLIVAHQLDQVRELAGEVLLVRNGRVLRGPSSELLAPEGLDLLFGEDPQPAER